MLLLQFTKEEKMEEPVTLTTEGFSLPSSPSSKDEAVTECTITMSTSSSEDVVVVVDEGGQDEEASSSSCGTSGVCRCGLDYLPPLNSKHWPQRPILIRPNPKSGTKILGIRKEKNNATASSSPEKQKYLWKPGSSKSWWTALQEEWNEDDSVPEGEEEEAGLVPPPPCCETCVILPINNGNEACGEALVADFESELWKGTVMIRIRHTNGVTTRDNNKSDDTKGYFANVNYKYEAVVRGNFKDSVPFTELFTGAKLERPVGKLPSSWIMWTASKLLKYFAPQLKVDLDTDTPTILSPLGSTARVIEVDSKEPIDYLGDERSEPAIENPERSLTGVSYDIEDELERARARKRHFDELFVAKDHGGTMWTDPSKTYTMEFLQHLFDYHKYKIDLGKMSYDMTNVLVGQPLQFMAAQGENCDRTLWAFEIWNESLLDAAQEHASAAGSSDSTSSS